MYNNSISELVQRHRISFSQIDRLKWGEVDRKAFLDEKVEVLSQAKHIRNILDQLEETSIFFICIKGFTLSNRLYQDPTVRTFRDLDIFVPDREDVVVLRKKLLDKGWIPVDEYWVEEQPARNWYMDLTMDLGLIEPESGLLVEIHWELDHQLVNLPQNKRKEFFIKHTEKMSVLNREVNVLSHELEFLYLIAHGAKHAWFRLKWLVDVHHYPFHLVDQNKFEKLVEKFNTQGLITQTNELLTIYFGKGFTFPFTGNVNPFLISYSIKQINANVSEDSPTLTQFINYLKYNWLITSNKIVAFRILFRTIGIRPQDISKVKLDAYWKYFFYRYYSLFRRKILKQEDVWKSAAL